MLRVVVEVVVCPGCWIMGRGAFRKLGGVFAMHVLGRSRSKVLVVLIALEIFVEFAHIWSICRRRFGGVQCGV